MKVCIISGRHPITKFKSFKNHRLYAKKFGYSYIHCKWPTEEKNPYLNKVHYILKYIDLYDFIVWIDDDAFFFDFEKDIMQFAPQGDVILSICKSPSFKELKTFLSSGQFILKSNVHAKNLLNKILRQDQNQVKQWWSDDLGYYTNGDQDILVYLLLTDSEFKSKFSLYDYKKFNSRVENLFGIDSHKPLILHFTGRPEIKMQNYKKVQNEFKLLPSLLPQKNKYISANKFLSRITKVFLDV